MKIFRLFYFLLIMLFLFSLNIYACGNFHPFFGWPNMMRWGWGGMFMGLFFLLFIGLIIYLMGKSVRTTKPEAISKAETPLEILKKRYVKGEINKEEYDRIKKDLQD
jgi:putative membrane protein